MKKSKSTTKRRLPDFIEEAFAIYQKVIETVQKEESIRDYPKVKEKLNYLKEVVKITKNTYNFH